MKFTKQTLQKMSRDKNVLRTVENVLMAQAYRETVEEIVKPQQHKVLQKHQFKISKEWTNKGRKPGVLTNPNHLELISDKDFKIYEKEMHEFYLDEGFNVDYGYCPLLIAENQERKAQDNLIKAIEPYTGITKENLMLSGNPLENYNKYIDINMRYFTQFVNKRELLNK
jgi:Fe-S cluster biosynthesis and repair protein YggX